VRSLVHVLVEALGPGAASGLFLAPFPRYGIRIFFHRILRFLGISRWMNQQGAPSVNLINSPTRYIIPSSAHHIV